jgi:hypothetical protein
MDTHSCCLFFLVLLYCSSFICSLKIPRRIVIGTRGSPLALAQAHQTKQLIEEKYPELTRNDGVTVKKIMTKVRLPMPLVLLFINTHCEG